MTNQEVIQTANTRQLAMWLANRMSCLYCPQKGLCDAEVMYSKQRCVELLATWLKENPEL